MTPATDDLFADGLAETPAIAILRGLDTNEAAERASHYWAAGVRLIEVPLQREVDFESLTRLQELRPKADCRIGAGTVLDDTTATRAVDAGASFLVGPGLSPAVAATAASLRVPYLPGAATATEISTALNVGCKWIKGFPATSLGATWFSAQRGPFPHIRLIAVGGVNASNAGSFLAAGAVAVAFGSSFTHPAQIAQVIEALRAQKRTSVAHD